MCRSLRWPSRLELAPELIGPAQQRHIGRMLEIAEPDDAASRRARSPGRARASERSIPSDADAAPRQPMERRAADDAEPHHDHVELRHRPTSDCERKHPCLVWRQAALKDGRVHAAPMAHDPRASGLALLGPCRSRSARRRRANPTSPDSPGAPARRKSRGSASSISTPLGDPAQAPWKNIILHQTEGAPGARSRWREGQARNPTKRGVTLWVETDGTIYWSTPETVDHHPRRRRQPQRQQVHRQFQDLPPGDQDQFNWRRIQRQRAGRAGAADARAIRGGPAAGAVSPGALRHPARAHLRPQLDRL